jgi:hypothetical protein
MHRASECRVEGVEADWRLYTKKKYLSDSTLGLTINESSIKAPSVITCRVTSRVFSRSSGVAYRPSLRKYGSAQVNLWRNK